MKQLINNLVRNLLLILTLTISSNAWASPLKGTYKDTNRSEKVLIASGYSNWGTDDDPEWAWCLSILQQDTDEVIEMYWCSENTCWAHFDQVRFFGPGTLELAEVNDGYALFTDSSIHNYIEIGTYGCRTTEGNFYPLYLLIRKFENGFAVNNIWIDYTPEIKRELYDMVKDAIKNLNMKETTLNILPND